MANEAFYIKKCREIIEEKLAWGSSENWQNQDFEVLSERIFEHTKISLSSSTLKRVWGKVRYDSTPNVATLNVLAQFAGFENWRAFTSEDSQPKEIHTNTETIKPIIVKRHIPKMVWWGAGIILLGLLTGIWAFRKKARPLIFGEVKFTSKPVTLGLPNTVIFQYDATDSNADSVFIQESWDSRRRFKADKKDHQYTSTYYYPGYYRAKLVLNDSIVREHDVYIETDGWLGTIEKDPIPVYLSKTQIQKEGVTGISEADLKAYQVDLRQDIPWVSLFRVRKDKTVPGDNFIFEAVVKNTFNKGNAICQQTQLRLLCSGGMHLIPLAIPGCVGELNLVLSNETISGKTNDLSGFGTIFDHWVHVRCEVRNSHARIFIDKKLAYEADFKQSIGNVIGTQIRFIGTAEIKGVKLSGFSEASI